VQYLTFVFTIAYLIFNLYFILIFLASYCKAIRFCGGTLGSLPLALLLQDSFFSALHTSNAVPLAFLQVRDAIIAVVYVNKAA